MRLLTISSCCLLIVSSLAAQPASDRSLSETYELVTEFMNVERVNLLEDELDLSRREANHFWPVFESYRAEIAETQARYADLISLFAEHHSDLSDQMAREMIGDYLAIQAELVSIRQKFVPQFLGAISAPKLARFFQVENKIDAVAELELILQIPLAED